MNHRRIIAHFDLDAFFVSVECIHDPSLKGKPLIVGGSKERGVVTACSYETRKFGVHSAMPMATAMRLCPQATVVKGTRGEYSRYSRMVTEIIAAKAPLFEKASIDEFYIDLTGMDTYFDPWQWTIDLRQEIIEKTGLPISFAIATNKMIAKIATNEAKPNGYIQVPAGMEKEYLAPLAVNTIPGIGKQTYQHLLNAGIKTIGDITLRSEKEMEQILGHYGMELWQKAHGRHDGAVTPYHEAKSVSTENTFEANTNETGFLLSELVRMAEKIGFELRQDDKMTGCVTVKIRYSDFETKSRQTSIPYTFYDDELIPVAKDLFHKLYKKGEHVRLLGVKFSELTNEARQTNLFENTEKKSSLYKAIDSVKNRFGKSAIGRGKPT
ncbi:MAG: DNA polymerase IV [Chitinophagaceae bacterium]|nr:DNA polymerase IV [Chitinophagaceae bacterium]MCW5927458.1 DNA polymerase IV [Chitinophagaceae bacterium]